MFSLRHHQRHALRAIAVILGVALGAAVFTGVRLAARASISSFENGMDAVTGKADAIITEPAGRVDERFVGQLLRLPEVAAASPIISAYVETANGQILHIFGVDPFLDRTFRSYSDKTARPELVFPLLDTPNTVILGATAAKQLGVNAHDTVHLTGGQKLTVLHVLHDDRFEAVDAGMVALADIATAQELTGTFGKVDRIDLRFLANTPIQRNISAVKRLLPEGYSLNPAEESGKTGRSMIRAYQQNLTVLSFVSLFAGMFLVYGLTSLNAASRRFEVSVLRALGASRSMIFGLFLADGAILGLAGWAISTPLSLGLLNHLAPVVNHTVNTLFTRVATGGVFIHGVEIVGALLLTVTVAILASARPALEAMRVSPREVLVTTGSTSTSPSQTWRWALAGGLLCLAAWPIAHIPGPSGVPLFGYFAVFCLFVGFSLCSPFLLEVMSKHVSVITGRIFGPMVMVGSREIEDAGPRAAVSVGALITAVGLFVCLSITIGSFRSTFNLWLDQTVSGDIFLRPQGAEENHYRFTLRPETIDWIIQHANSATIMAYNRYYLDIHGVPVQFETTDFHVYRTHSQFLFLTPATASQQLNALREAEQGHGAIVSEVFANQTGLGQGDLLQLHVDGIELKTPIVAVVRSYRTRGGVVFFDRSAFANLSNASPPLWGGARIFFRGPKPEAQAQQFHDQFLREAPAAATVQATLGSQLRHIVRGIFEDTFAVTSLLLVIALIVAAIGIATTLTVMVLERSQRLNTLRALGASRHQIRLLIVWQALSLCMCGMILGSGAGLILADLVINVVNKVSFGWTFVFTFNPLELSLTLPLVFLAGLAASLPAAAAALRKPIAEVLRGQHP